MADKEKVIKALEYCVGTLAAEPCKKCPYFMVDEECDRMVLRDAYELLKEQEATYIESITRYYSAGYEYGKKYAENKLIISLVVGHIVGVIAAILTCILVA